MSKGSANAAKNQVGIDNSWANQYGGLASGIGGQLTPFLENELRNPQGFGQEDLSKMITQGGQATAGAVGAGGEAAMLNASRTGNTAAVPGVIDSTARAGMRQQSNNVLGTDLANEQLKERQRQAGAGGLESLYGTDLSAALKSLGLADESINAWTGGKAAADKNVFDWTKLGLQTAGSVVGAGGG
jgi:hypothetical protein